MKTYTQVEIKAFLKKLNTTYARLHKSYENYFWKSYMGQPEYDEKMNLAMERRDAFRGNRKHLETISSMLKTAPHNLKASLNHWQRFFELHQVPQQNIEVRKKIATLENKIAQKLNFLKEGYIDPKTKKFKKMSKTQMKTALAVEPDEKLRKAYLSYFSTRIYNYFITAP